MLSVRSLVRLVLLMIVAVIGAAALPQRAKAQAGPCQSPDGILYTISPCNPSISQLATTTITVAESLYVNGGNGTPGTFSCTASGVVTSCAVSPTTFVNGESEIDSIKVTGILGNSAGTGSITVTATGPTAIAQTVISVTALPTVTVAAEYGPNDWYDSSQVGITNHRFLIANHTAGSLTYNVSLTGCSANACTLRNGSSVTVPANGTGFDSVTYNSGNLGQTFTGTFTATQTTNSTQTASVTVTQHAALDRVKGVIVHTLTDHGNIRTGADTTQFSVTNKSRFSAGVNLAATCAGPAFTGTCTVSPASPITVPASGTSTVSVISTGSSTIGATGYVKLVVTPPTYPGGADSAITDVTVTAQPAPGIVLTTRSVNFNNSDCLTVSIQPGAAYACGDLRIAHALPAAWTYGKKRQPVLVYRAQTARPWTVERGLVTLDPTKGTPDSVTATMCCTFHGSYPGTDFANGATRQVALWTYLSHAIEPEAFGDGGSLTLQVNAYYGATNIAYSATDPALIDIRDTSKIGPGWGIAGLEYLRIQPQTGGPPWWFWYGADGSIHHYGSVNMGGGVFKWVAASLDRPDTIIRVDSSGRVTFRRLAPHGVQVVFDSATGHHIATIDRLKHVTQFYYHAGTYMDLDSMTAPAPGGRHLTWRFVYDSTGYLASIIGPPVTGQNRTVTFTHAPTSHVLTKITDQDGSSESFTYSAYDRPSDPGVIVSYTDKIGTVTAFTYDSTYFLRQAVRDTGTGHLNVTLQFTPAETRGLGKVDTVTASAPPDSVYTLANGPRLNVNLNKIWINAYGQPTRVRDALGYETVVQRTDSRWPTLVTRERRANGQVLSATYDGRGNVATHTDSTTFVVVNGVTTYSTDSAFWDQTWDFAARTVSATGVESWFELDPATGNRKAQMTLTTPAADTAGNARWIRFGYDATTSLLQSVTTSLTGPTSVQYDTMGNVAAQGTSLGYWTTLFRDNIGRDTLVVSTIDSTDFVPYPVTGDGFNHKFSIKHYDALDRPTSTSDSANSMSLYEPCHGGSFTAQGLAADIVTTYNANGSVASIERWSNPDSPGIGHAINRVHYDALGRKIVEIQPDGTQDSLVVDAAGNVITIVNRLGYVLTAAYDAENQRISAIMPAATPRDTTTPEFGFYPRYADNGDGRGELLSSSNVPLGVPADTQTFTYDPVGKPRTAFNRDAHVSRTYNPSGTVATDTLRIRTYSGIDFLTHVYGLSFSYDLDSRRTAIHQPTTLAFTPTDSESFTYDNTTGNLYASTDVRGNWFQHLYDQIDRLSTLAYFEHGNNTSISAETFAYDGDSWLFWHQDYMTLADQSDTGWTNHQLRADTNSHDGRGKLMNVHVHQGQLAHAEHVRNRYDGLGQLAAYKRSLVNSDGSEDDEGPIQDLEYNAADAFGNEGSVNTCTPNGNGQDRTYQAATGRITFQRWADDADPLNNSVAHEWDVFNNEGDLTFQRRDGGFERGQTNAVENDESVNFYGADGALHYVDRRNNYPVYADSANVNQLTFYKVYFDEYRYDALGRRIMRRSRANSDCISYNCFSMMQRFVYDGEDLLWEITRPGWDTVSVANLEADTVTLQPDSRFYGRVLYLNSGQQERPLDIIRYGLSIPYSGNRSHLWPAQVIVPHYNWIDQPDWISFESGQQYTCQPAPNHDECAIYRLPDATNAFLHNGTWPVATWLGTTLNGETENQGNGLQYKQTRFYDPLTGVFTQADPIGLAGGLNAYGFAGGDPVSYRDPQGTCGPVCIILIGAAVGAALDASYHAYQIYSHGGTLTFANVFGAALTGAMEGASLASNVVAIQDALAAVPADALELSNAQALTAEPATSVAEANADQSYSIQYDPKVDTKKDFFHNFPTSKVREVIDDRLQDGQGQTAGYNLYKTGGIAHQGSSKTWYLGHFEVGGFWRSNNTVFYVTHRFFNPDLGSIKLWF